MSEMIVLTIGPVQSYISQARRTQDLWQGSRILSYLASIGVAYAKDMEQQELAEVIYPVVPDLVASEDLDDPDIRRDQPANIPNRIVVRWFGDHAGARECASQMQAEIEDAWKRISDNTRRYFLDHNHLQAVSNEIDVIWQRQEQNWLECYWVVVPENEASHADNMLRANYAMGARKLMRNFRQSHERGIKCSITGEHEILHDGRRMAEWSEFWKDIRANQRNRALLGEHERLSAISMIKRFAHEREAGNPLALQFGKRRFPSTSSIASAPFKYDVLCELNGSEADGLHRAINNFLDALRAMFRSDEDLYFVQEGDYNEEYFGLIERDISPDVLQNDVVRRFRSIDGDFLFEDTLIAKTIEEYSGWQRETDKEKAELKAQLRNARKALGRLIKKAQRLDIPKPQPYFVVLSMDGDHMGRTLGELLDADQHRDFSTALARFAREDVIRIVEQEHLGRVVYAGGDDVLALLPVRDALKVANDLRVKFQEMMDSARIRDRDENFISATVSTGLAYVHHTHNLQDAVRAAGDAQKHIAKEDLDRNAIGVKLLRRSGEPREMGQKWQLSGAFLYDHVYALTQAFDTHLSRNLPYDIAQIAYSMTGNGVTDTAREAELRRVLKRRLPGELKDKDATVYSLSDSILALVNGATEDLESQWRNAQHWLELARFIAQKESGA